MKKIELIEAVNKRLPVKQHIKMVAIYIGRAYNQIMFEIFGRNPSKLDLLIHVYPNVAIKYDSVQDVWYSDLPINIIKMPHVGDGVRAIHSNKGKTIEFIPELREMVYIHNDLEVSDMDGVIPYYVTHNRVEYKYMNGIDQMQTVRMHLVPEFEALDNLEEIHLPGGADERIMELAVNFASGIKPAKEINDNSEKTV